MENQKADAIFEVHEAEFQKRVIERSREVPVVVDFWAEWCGPCRALGPALEQAVTERAGKVELAKVDVDRNQSLSAQFGVQGIPAVKAFHDGAVVSEFTGAIPPAQIASFLDQLTPSEAELAAEAALESGDEVQLRRALESDPGNTRLASALARALIERDEPQAALDVAQPLAETDFELAGLAAQARLALADAQPAAVADALAALRQGSHEPALEQLQAAVAEAEGDQRDLLRQVMVGIFAQLGAGSELAASHRRRLASALS